MTRLKPRTLGGIDPGGPTHYAARPMLQGLTHLARQARPWTFGEARNILARVLKTRLDTDGERDLAATLIDADKWDELLATLPALRRPVVFQCGYGASGLPHVGTFGEAARPTMVRAAFRALTNDAIPTKLMIFSDDMDGLRKIPPNLPHQDWLEEDRDKPVTSVRDPFGEYESFGAHNNARARAFFDCIRLRLRVHLRHRLLQVGPDGCGAAHHPGAVRRRAGGDAADPGAGPARHLFAVPADQPDVRPGALRADAGAASRPRHDRLRGRGRHAWSRRR